MRPHNSIAVLAAGVAFACTSNPAPDNWLPQAQEVPTFTYGAWIEVEYGPEESHSRLGGEFLAVHADTVFVLFGDSLVAFSADSVRKARIAWFESGSSSLAAWTILGTLGTLSHGYLAGITMPLWIIVGSTATGAQTRAPIEDYDHDDRQWSDLGKYARFPQGIPSSLDRAALRPRTYSAER